MAEQKSGGLAGEDITQDLLLLYELSLSIGQTLDPRITCREFLRILVARRNLNGAFIWWLAPESGDPAKATLKLLDGVPRSQYEKDSLPLSHPLSHPLWQLTRNGQSRILTVQSAEMAALAGEGVATCALLPLGEEGVLQLNSSTEDTFTLRTVKQLRPVLAKLTNAIKGGFAHEGLRRSEAALRESEHKLLTILDNVDACIYVKGMDGRYIFANRAVRDLWHAEMKDIVGSGDEKFFDMLTVMNIRLNDRRVLIEGQTLRAEEVNTVSQTAKTVIYQSTKLPLRNDEGKIYALCGISTDITTRKLAEEEIAQRELQLRTLIEAVPDSIQFKDENGRWQVANSVCLRTFGLEGRDWQGLTDTELGVIYPHVAKLLASCKISDDIALRSGEPYRLEEQFTGRDGNVAYYDVVKVPLLDKVRKSRALVVVSRDITERKRADQLLQESEARLRESQKMESLGTLAGGIAHDFNNILATPLGNIELIRGDFGLGHDALESLEEIGIASRRAVDLVQQILAFGRRQNVTRKAATLAMVVLESARMIRATLPAAVTLNVSCDAGVPVVLADATQIKQILINLCSNALHAVENIERPGVIDVRLEGVTHQQANGSLGAGRYARLVVEDNGAGMDEVTRSRIFEPFFTTKPVGQGSGMGLAVVHSMVHAHDGVIEVESTPGSGSRFRIYFPEVANVAEEAAAPVPDGDPVDGGGKHVLFVDDETAIVLLMKRLLERRGYVVTAFTDPLKALDAVCTDSHRFDIVITDFNMPGMSGLELALAFKAIRADLPVLLASGYITEELRKKAPAAGIKQLIHKPSTVEELCQAVARFAQGTASSGSAEK